MRIDVSNLLLAAQIHPSRTQPAAKPSSPQSFEPLNFGKPDSLREEKPAAQPGAIARPGAQLDIKV